MYTRRLSQSPQTPRSLGQNGQCHRSQFIVTPIVVLVVGLLRQTGGYGNIHVTGNGVSKSRPHAGDAIFMHGSARALHTQELTKRSLGWFAVKVGMVLVLDRST